MRKRKPSVHYRESCEKTGHILEWDPMNIFEVKWGLIVLEISLKIIQKHATFNLIASVSGTYRVMHTLSVTTDY